jgi:dTDP-glucose 4,6-dehydratase
MDWSHQTVLVTGAGGFIGSHLTELLVERGAKTRAMVRYTSTGSWGWLGSSPRKRDIQVIPTDVSDPDGVRRAMKGVDVVFHLAALIGIPYSYESPAAYVRTNVTGTLHVLQAALDAGVQRVVHTSTSEVYGSARYVPIDELHPLVGQSPYSATKIAADKLAESFHLAYGLPVATIRPFNTFGPRQSSRAVIPTIMTQALAKSEVRIGDLTPLRDLNFVADTVEGFVRMAECPAAVGEVVNIGSGREISIGDLAKLILGLLGKDVPLIAEAQRTRPSQSEVLRLQCDNRKAKRILDWAPRHTLEEGLKQTLAFLETHIGSYRVDSYSV